MGLRSLEFTIEMDGQKVSRNIGISKDEMAFSKQELAEMLANALIREALEKPDIIKGMVTMLLDHVEKTR